MVRTRTAILLSFLAGSAAAAQSPAAAPAVDTAAADRIIASMTVAQELDYLGGAGFMTRPVPALDLPGFTMVDGAMGVRTESGAPAAAYAGGIALAASWDTQLARQVGASIGAEARARGVHFLLAPGVNLVRSPLGGRNGEYFGEDPFLSARIAVGYIEGVQSQGVSATIKHFVGNEGELNRHTIDSVIDERTLREIYLPPFEAAVREAGVGAAIASYNLTNGAAMSVNRPLNVDVLRGEWGFRGVLMTDWAAATTSLATFQGGIDLDMPRGDWLSAKTLLPYLQAGTITKTEIDEKVRHILYPAMKFGWLARPQTLGTPGVAVQAAATALRSAQEGAVLVKNAGGLLPLDPGKVRTILVVGSAAEPGEATLGGSGGVSPTHTVGVLEGLRAVMGEHARILYDRGVPAFDDLVNATALTQDEAGAISGVRVETYQNAGLTGAPIETTQAGINAPGVPWSDFQDDPAAISNAFATARKARRSRRWTGFYHADAAGAYQIALRGSGENNGARVFVDGRLVIDTWDASSSYQTDRALTLSTGAHKIVVEDRQAGPLGGRVKLALARADELVSARALDLAKQADVVVAAVGFDHRNEGEGADRDFALPIGQDRLIRELAARNPHVVAVVTAGGPVAMTDWLDRVPAVLYGWYAGQDGGTAQAQILTGLVNPSGHLPVTLARDLLDYPSLRTAKAEDGATKAVYREGVFAGYRGFGGRGAKPLYAFGHGLSYTSFRFDGLRVPATAAVGRLDMTVSFTVTNTGKRAGATVAQLYVSDGHAPVARPERELKGFARVMLEPGESRRVEIPLDRRSFAYFDTARHAWAVAPGRFTVRIGAASDDTPLAASVRLQ